MYAIFLQGSELMELLKKKFFPLLMLIKYCQVSLLLLHTLWQYFFYSSQILYWAKIWKKAFSKSLFEIFFQKKKIDFGLSGNYQNLHFSVFQFNIVHYYAQIYLQLPNDYSPLIQNSCISVSTFQTQYVHHQIFF